ncbi:TonB-dependent receptor domain-containing protein [Polaribacter porphyrae]|uniref:TonB-dependent receptor n=1 Tax=Polaribacter porphyrae TaxID=1137780 RepID=A0A2S7WMT5_9FLAO|nr:TonB-dependent receptor [Polaribacter porphyrae]PQJ78571.1 TonB-dependent receptor [Polaribacter porphyrae]
MKNCILIIILLITFSGFSQFKISGKITDDKNTPLEAVAVSLINFNTKKFVKAAITNTKGNFSLLNIKEDNYFLKIESLGFQTYKTRRFKLSESIDFGNLPLKTSSEKLDEVVIKTEKPMVQVLADKTVFNVQNTINAAGDSGFDLLRKAPGIVIDNNNNIIVEGKNGVLIYIDGKPSILRGEDLVNFLQTLQSTDIESVEIITQPSSKYDAEGNAGIINIVLKRDKTLGTNGSLTSGYTQGDFGRFNNSVSFNYRAKKTSLYGSISNAQGDNFGFLNLYRIQNNTIFDAKTETVSDYNRTNTRFGFDYFANKKSTFGIILSGNFSDLLSNSNSRTPITPQNQNNPDNVLVAGSDTNSDVYNLYGNVNYKFDNKKGTTFNVDVDFGKYSRDRDNLQPNSYFNGDETQVISETTFFIVSPTTINLFSAKADYEQKFLRGKLSFGVKFSKINTENDFDFFNRNNGNNVLDNTRSNDFDYNETINAAYINFNKKFKKFNYQIGLRVENTDSKGTLTSMQANNNNVVPRNYTDFFPSAGVTYKVNRNNSWALNYSRRIQRPNYQNLNPFENRIDELSFRKGNPFLQPQYTNNFKLSHTYKYRLNTSLSYSFIKDLFAQITEAGANNQNFINVRNVANQRVYNLGVSYPSKFTNWWSYYISINASRNEFIATNPDFLSISQNSLSFYAQNTFKLPNDFRFEVSGWYNSPSIWGGTYRTNSLGSLNLALQKKFLDDKLNVRIGVDDVLFTSPWSGTTQFGDLFIDGSGGRDSRQFKINLTYNFGGNEIKKARKRKTGIEDEKSRI